MKRVYVSSTYQDLKDYRSAVFGALRKMRCDVIGMEDYPAKDQRTVARCEQDVAACELYIGIFAWRYGYIPEEDNPDKKSITELEYRKARVYSKTCLLFLLDDMAPWPPHLIDSHTGANAAGERMKQFRAELQRHSPALFRSPEDLAAQVTAAVYQDESTKRVGKLAFFNEINSLDMGPSGLPNIREKILEAKNAEVVEINLGVGESWWSTRLHLVAALATDFTRIQQLVFTAQDIPTAFVDGTGPPRVHFIGMFSPADVRHALANKFPDVEIAYLRSLSPPDSASRDPVWDVTRVVGNFGAQMHQLSQGQGEASIKVWVDEDKLRGWMARNQNADVVERTGQPTALLQHQIVSCRSPFVALVEQGRPIQVMDRLAMATNIARTVLEEGLG